MNNLRTKNKNSLIIILLLSLILNLIAAYFYNLYQLDCESTKAFEGNSNLFLTSILIIGFVYAVMPRLVSKIIYLFNNIAFICTGKVGIANDKESLFTEENSLNMQESSHLIIYNIIFLPLMFAIKVIIDLLFHEHLKSTGLANNVDCYNILGLFLHLTLPILVSYLYLFAKKLPISQNIRLITVSATC
jgi:hypothetical protein